MLIIVCTFIILLLRTLESHHLHVACYSHRRFASSMGLSERREASKAVRMRGNTVIARQHHKGRQGLYKNQHSVHMSSCSMYNIIYLRLRQRERDRARFLAHTTVKRVDRLQQVRSLQSRDDLLRLQNRPRLGCNKTERAIGRHDLHTSYTQLTSMLTTLIERAHSKILHAIQGLHPCVEEIA